MDLERQTIIPKRMLTIGKIIQNIMGFVNIKRESESQERNACRPTILEAGQFRCVRNFQSNPRKITSVVNIPGT